MLGETTRSIKLEGMTLLSEEEGEGGEVSLAGALLTRIISTNLEILLVMELTGQEDPHRM